MTAILIIHAGATLFLCGLIWIVQVVHYPLFARVDRRAFPDYEREHQVRIARVVAPAMLVELGTGVLLAVNPPSAVHPAVWVAGLALIAWVWASTFFGAVPQHRRLRDGYRSDAHRALLQANWHRTAAWSLRSVLVMWILSPGAVTR